MKINKKEFEKGIVLSKNIYTRLRKRKAYFQVSHAKRMCYHYSDKAPRIYQIYNNSLKVEKVLIYQ